MFNKVVLIGRLTADPQLKQTQNSVSVVSFTLAIDRSYTGKSSERVTDFIECVAWRSTAEFICKYFSKGRLIGVEGVIQTRSYEDKNGSKRKAVEVVADNAFFTESKGSGGGNQPPQQCEVPLDRPGTGGFTEVSAEDDLPFN